MDEDVVDSGQTVLTAKDELMFFGYLDAGSGSLILQAILGGAAGILVAFKAWKARLMGKRALAETGEAGPAADEPVTSDS